MATQPLDAPPLARAAGSSGSSGNVAFAVTDTLCPAAVPPGSPRQNALPQRDHKGVLQRPERRDLRVAPQALADASRNGEAARVWVTRHVSSVSSAPH